MTIKNIDIEEIKNQITEDAETVKTSILAGLCKIQAVAKAIASIPPETLVEVASATSNVVSAYGQVALSILPMIEAIASVVVEPETETAPTTSSSTPYEMGEKVETVVTEELENNVRELFK